MPVFAPRAFAFASASTLVGATAVVYGSLLVVPRIGAGQIAIPVAFGAPLLLAGAAVLAILVAWCPGEVEAAMGLARGSIARLRWAFVAGLALAALGAALLLASDVWAYTTLGWAVPPGAPMFVG
jgi:hypothetical protein